MLSPSIEYVWDWFTDVFDPMGRGNGAYRLNFVEIKAYADLMGISMRPWEVLLMRRLSDVYLEVQAAKAQEPKPPPGVKNLVSDAKGLRDIFERVGGDKPKSKKFGAPRSAGAKAR